MNQKLSSLKRERIDSGPSNFLSLYIALFNVCLLRFFCHAFLLLWMSWQFPLLELKLSISLLINEHVLQGVWYHSTWCRAYVQRFFSLKPVKKLVLLNFQEIFDKSGSKKFGGLFPAATSRRKFLVNFLFFLLCSCMNKYDQVTAPLLIPFY